MTYMTNYNCTSGDVKPKHSNIREVQWWNFNPLIEIQSLHRLKCINSIVRLHYFIIEISIFNPLISLVHHWNFNDEIFIIELNCSVHHWNWHQDWNDEQFQKDIEIALFILDLRVWWKCTAPVQTLILVRSFCGRASRGAVSLLVRSFSGRASRGAVSLLAHGGYIAFLAALRAVLFPFLYREGT